jgi:hypothetical protein
MFSRAATDIPVGPAPAGKDLRASNSRKDRPRRGWPVAAVAAAAGAIVVAAVVISTIFDTDPEDATTSGPSVAGGHERMRLDCPNHLRKTWIMDDFTPSGVASPIAVAMPYVDRESGEGATVTKNRDGTHVWILRPDKSVRARFDVYYSARFGGWLQGTVETCADDGRKNYEQMIIDRHTATRCRTPRSSRTPPRRRRRGHWRSLSLPDSSDRRFALVHRDEGASDSVGAQERNEPRRGSIRCGRGRLGRRCRRRSGDGGGFRRGRRIARTG